MENCLPAPISLFLNFEVEDTGPGIAPEDIDIIFEAFTQTATGRKSIEGTGLGLPISRKFVQLMGGDITVSSTLGKGTIFKFDVEVSLSQTSDLQMLQPTRRIIGIAAGQPEYRILVVDDATESRLLLMKLLASVGFSVREAANGQEALDQWKLFQPHLIWMDMRMPVMDGYEATKHIKTEQQQRWGDGKILSASPSSIRHPQTGLPPDALTPSSPNPFRTIIIALTASAFEEERHLVLSIGCDDFVRKPFREQVIFEKMAQYLGVCYIYEELDPLEPTEEFATKQGVRGKKLNSSFTLQPSSFQLMPSAWVNQLYQAVDSVDDEAIFHLLEQIPPDHAPLATAIADLIKNFRYDRLIDLMEAAENFKLEESC
jgi:CheY-like chemotaxis protein